MSRWEPPVVAVQHPHVRDDKNKLIAIDDLLYVWCTDCGEVTDYTDTRDSERHRLQRIAARHAEEKHEGLVDAVGWAR